MKRFIVAITLLLLLGGCAQTQVAENNNSRDNGRVNHMILIWLKDHGNLEQRQQVIDATKALQQIPGVISVRVGTVMPSERNIVDDSFDVGVHMLFADRQSMKRYTSNPEHVRTVNQIVLPLTQRLVIYDFEE